MKTCNKCGIAKPLDQFQRHAQKKDGHLGTCKPCSHVHMNAYRAANRDRFRELARIKNRSQRVIQQTTERVRRRHQADRRIGRAYAAVARAIKLGRMVKESCKTCGTNCKVQAHHESYDRKLDVVWFCPPCHKARHMEMQRMGVKP